MSRSAINAGQGVAIGPYSHAIDTGDLVFLSGQTPLDPQTGRLVTGGIGEQARQCLDNLRAVLQASGLDLDDVVKCTVFLTDMADFSDMNAVYAEYFAEPYPARTTIAVAGLPLGAHIEIELVAQRPDH